MYYIGCTDFKRITLVKIRLHMKQNVYVFRIMFVYFYTNRLKIRDQIIQITLFGCCYGLFLLQIYELRLTRSIKRQSLFSLSPMNLQNMRKRNHA